MAARGYLFCNHGIKVVVRLCAKLSHALLFGVRSILRDSKKSRTRTSTTRNRIVHQVCISRLGTFEVFRQKIKFMVARAAHGEPTAQHCNPAPHTCMLAWTDKAATRETRALQPQHIWPGSATKTQRKRGRQQYTNERSIRFKWPSRLSSPPSVYSQSQPPSITAI